MKTKRDLGYITPHWTLDWNGWKARWRALTNILFIRIFQNILRCSKIYVVCYCVIIFPLTCVTPTNWYCIWSYLVLSQIDPFLNSLLFKYLLFFVIVELFQKNSNITYPSNENKSLVDNKHNLFDMIWSKKDISTGWEHALWFIKLQTTLADSIKHFLQILSCSSWLDTWMVISSCKFTVFSIPSIISAIAFWKLSLAE